MVRKLLQNLKYSTCATWLIPIFFGCVLSLLFAGCSSSDKAKDESKLRLQLGTGHLEKGNYPAALKELLLAEQLDPQNAIVQNNLGLTYFVREKNDLAEMHLQKAVQLAPKYTDALNNLARVHIEMGRYDQAIKELRVVLSDLTYSSADKAWVNLGLAQFKKGQFQEARKSLIEAIQLNRQHCLAQNLYGRTLLELNEVQLAADSLDRAVALCKGSNFDEPHYFSGLAYQKMGNNGKAAARMEEVVKLYPFGKYAPKAQARLREIGR